MGATSQVAKNARILIALIVALLAEPASASDEQPKNGKAQDINEIRYSVLSEDDIKSLPDNISWEPFYKKFGPPIPCCVSICLYLKAEADRRQLPNSFNIYDYYWIIPEETNSCKGIKINSILIFSFDVDTESGVQNGDIVEMVCVYPVQFAGKLFTDFQFGIDAKAAPKN